MNTELVFAEPGWDGADGLLAVIVHDGPMPPGVTFFTDRQFPQQVASISHPKGHTVPAHSHNYVRREINQTSEVIFVRKGLMRVDFFDRVNTYVCSKTVGAGEILILIRGGHGMFIIEDVEMFEVKQGPYVGRDLDKKEIPRPAK